MEKRIKFDIPIPEDILQIKNIESGFFLNTYNIPTDGENIRFGNINPVNIQFLTAKHSASQISNLNPVKYGDYITIIVPGTSLTLRMKVGEEQMYWTSSISNLSNTDFLFQIMPINDSQKIGDLVTYNSPFNIIYSNVSILVVGNTNYELSAKYSNFENEKSNPDSFSTFSAISKMTGYYCDGKECKDVPISEIDSDGQSGTYKGAYVGRSKGCLGICNYSTTENNKIYNFTAHSPPYNYYNNDALLIVIMSIIVIIGIVLIHLYFKKKN